MNTEYENTTAVDIENMGIEDVEEDMENSEELEAKRPDGYTGKIITSLTKAIRAKCLDCCCGQASEVKLCPATDCPCWPFRLGKNPYRTRTVSDDERAKMGERLAKARASRKCFTEV